MRNAPPRSEYVTAEWEVPLGEIPLPSQIVIKSDATILINNSEELNY